MVNQDLDKDVELDTTNALEHDSEQADTTVETADDMKPSDVAVDKIDGDDVIAETDSSVDRSDTSQDDPSDADSDNGDDNNTDDADTADTADEDNDEDATYGIPLSKVEAVLNATADKVTLTPQIQRMMQRQAENTRRVEDSIKGTKSNPRWFVPLFCTLMILGLLWAVVYYLTVNHGGYPIPGIGAWNLGIAICIILLGFILTMWWR